MLRPDNSPRRPCLPSYPLQRPKRRCWPDDVDGIARLHQSTHQHDAHNPRFAHQITLCIVIEDSSQQSWLKRIELRTRVAQPGNLHNCCRTDLEPCVDGQREQIDAACGHIFAQLAGEYYEARRPQFIVQFGVDQVYLAQVWLRRVGRHARAMLDRRSHMCIARHTQAGQQLDDWFIYLISY